MDNIPQVTFFFVQNDTPPLTTRSYENINTSLYSRFDVNNSNLIVFKGGTLSVFRLCDIMENKIRKR